MPLTATTSPASRRSTAASTAASPVSSTVPSGSRHATCGPHVGQALGWAWNRRSAGSSYSAWHAAHIVKPAIVVAGRSYGTDTTIVYRGPQSVQLVNGYRWRRSVGSATSAMHAEHGAVSTLTGTAGAPCSSLCSIAEPGVRRRPARSTAETTSSTRASGGASSRSETASASIVDGSPSTSMSTPPLSLRTKPARPSSTARR